MNRKLQKNIQSYLKENKIDAWLVYQFIDTNPFFKRIIGVEDKVVTRRTILIIPKIGKLKLIHSTVDGGFDDLGIGEVVYTSFLEFKDACKKELGKFKKVAMEYSPFSSIPHISKVDAGIVDLIRSFGIEVVSSGDLIQMVERFSEEEVKSHIVAANMLDKVRKWVFVKIEKSLKSGKKVDEYIIQKMILNRFKRENLETVYAPQTTINENSARGHYIPSRKNSKELKPGDLLLIDMWAKLPGKTNIYADITWMLFRGKKIPTKYEKIFNLLVRSRDKAISFLNERVRRKINTFGWEVDKIAREEIENAGYGKYFTHRLGHSIGTFVHGNLTHLDNFENKDTRRIFPNHISSVEPGIYVQGKFGMRTEVNILVKENKVEITTEVQDKIVLLP